MTKTTKALIIISAPKTIDLTQFWSEFVSFPIEDWVGDPNDLILTYAIEYLANKIDQ